MAAEYALGVLDREQMSNAALRMEHDALFRQAVEGWHNQLTPMLDEVEEVRPPSFIWGKIAQEIGPIPRTEVPEPSSGLGIWKFLTALSSTAAIVCVGLLLVSTGGDLTGKNLRVAQKELVAVKTENEQIKSENLSLQSSLDNVIDERDAAHELTSSQSRSLSSLRAEVTALREAQPLVASLSENGDAPAFVAQYDPVKKSLLIRTSIEDENEKVPEIWLIPAQGDREGEVLSLGVMQEDRPDQLLIADDLVSAIGEGGTLAITMEPPGGAPNGVATGPIIALGKLLALK